MLKVIISIVFALLAYVAAVKINTDAAVLKVGRDRNCMNILIDSNNLEARHIRAQIAWNEAILNRNKWDKKMVNSVMQAAYLDMQRIFKEAPGYKNTKESFTIMQKCKGL